MTRALELVGTLGVAQGTLSKACIHNLTSPKPRWRLPSGRGICRPRSVGNPRRSASLEGALDRFCFAWTTRSTLKVDPSLEKQQDDSKSPQRLGADLWTKLGEKAPNLPVNDHENGTWRLPSVADTWKLCDFQFVTMLGYGSFGHVALVEQRATKERFALKRVPALLEADSWLAEEVEVLHAFRDAGPETGFLVQFLKDFCWKGATYLLQEALLGGDLQEVVEDGRFWQGQERTGCLGQVPESAARFYVACLVEALSALHSKGFVHRDVKLGNMLLDERGYAKLGDFGHATRIAKGEQIAGMCGTPAYMAPEVAKGLPYDASADLWSLGVTIFKLLVGYGPFDTEGDETAAIMARIKDPVPPAMPVDILSQSAQNLILRLLKEDPHKRIGRTNMNEIRNHKWFEGFDWEALQQGTMQAPYIPEIFQREGVAINRGAASGMGEGELVNFRGGSTMERMILPSEEECTEDDK